MALQLFSYSVKKISVIKSLFLIIFMFSTALGSKVFAQYNSGKIAVLVVGDGTTYAAGTAAPVFIKEFNITGTGQTGTVRTSLPATAVGGTTAVNRALTQNISAISEGFLQLSANRQLLTLTGYNVSSGTASVTSSSSATFPANTRVVGKIGIDGLADTRTTLHTFTSSGTRGAVTVDGTAYWLSLAAGVSYVPDANITSSVVNLNTTLVRGIGIFNNQLYTTSASGSIRLARVGSGLPTTTGQTLTNLPGLPTTTSDPYGFVFLNTDATAGPDVVYVASSNTAPTGILKYTSSDQGATWTANGSLTGFGIGVTAVYNSCTGSADLYILSATAANVKPTFLYKYTDNAAASSTLSLAISSGTLLATAAANTGFGGVAFTPGSTLIAPASYTVTGGNGCENSGVNIGLSGSETGVSYQLMNGAAPVGAAIIGTGAAINFGSHTSAGLYTVIATNVLSGCTATMMGSSVVHALPTVSFSGLPAAVCVNAASITLTGNNAPGGTFTGPGITDNGNGTASFNPATAGVGGPYSIIYTYTSVNGCTNLSSQPILVNAVPLVSFSGLFSNFCSNSPAVTLTGSPAGGTFSGPGISGNTFDPATAGAGGPYTITYSYTDGNGCTNSASQTVNVDASPAITGTSPATRCGAGTVVLGATGTGSDINWYASAAGNDYLGSGNSFTTPQINTTTQFYAAAFNGGLNAGLGNTSIPPSNAGYVAQRGIVFNASQAFTLVSAQYYSSNLNVTNSVLVVLQDNTGAPIQTVTLPIVQGATPGWYTMNLNWNITPGNGYRLLAQFTQTVHRDLGANYALPAYNNLGSAGIITSGWDNGVSSTTYNYFHNISIIEGCSSARTAVTATVNPSTAISVSATNLTVCSGNSSQLSVSSSNDPNYTYSWTSVPAGFTQTGSGPFTVSPTTAITYNVFAQDNTSGNPNSGCGAVGSVTVIGFTNTLIVNPTAIPATICLGANSQLNAAISLCQAGSTRNGCNTGDEYIGNVSFNTINNTSTCPPSGQYTDFTAISTDINAGSSYIASVLNPNWFNGDQASVWIDFNHNNLFGDPGEYFALITGGGNGTTPLSGTVSIPATAVNGTAIMRVRYNFTGAMLPCGITTFGETEDYTVNISGGSGTAANFTYDWSTNPTFLSAINISNPLATGVTSNQTYSVTVTDQATGCIKSASVNVTVSIPTVVITTGTNCSTGGAIQLNATATAGTGGGSITSYQWLLDGSPIGGANAATYEASTTGSYTITVTNSLGCSVTSDPYILSVINTALNGTYTINSTLPASCTNYISMATAISDLNTKGVSGNVLFNVASGHTETAPAGGLVINYCALSASLMPSATQTVIFQGGAVPALITAPVGTSTSVDGIVKLVGADYITFNKIDLQESAANVDATTQMEWGYALLKCDGNNGSGHNTISNCAVTLNKSNVFSRGIYSGNHTGATLTNLTYTGTAGDPMQVDSSRNGYNSFVNNSIQNVYSAISLSGNTATSGTRSLNDTMNVVGNTGQGNTITDYGGSSAAAIAVNLSGQRSTKVIGNTISGGAGNTSTVTGIQLQSGLWAEVKDNTVSLSSNATTSSVIGITCGLSGGSAAFPNTVTITGNTIQGINYATATTGQLIGLTSSSGGTGSVINISNNTVQNNTLTGTGTLTGIANTAASGTLTMNSNIATGNSKSGTGTMTLIDAGSIGTTTTTSMNSNQVTNNQITGAFGTLNCTRAGSTQVTYNGNIVNNNSIPNTSGASSSAIYGYINVAAPTVDNLTNNLVDNLSIGGSNTSTANIINGLYTFSISSTAKTISGNIIRDLNMSTAGNIRGILHDAGATVNIFKNKIYNLSSISSSATVLVEGININAGTTTRVYNNLIGNLSAASAASADAIRGISSISGTANSTLGFYFNTIYLSGSSTGANFGSTGIFHTTSTTATTATLDMRNNIVVNNCTPTGTGRAVAYRRSSTTLTNFAASSNNNIYYVTPGANNHIFSDGTNHLDLPGYKAFAGISPREISSQDENVAFQSTTGSDAAFLKVNTGIPTVVEKGGQPISTITDDYFGTVRNTLVPDIGAHEDNFVNEFPVFVSLSASPATPQCVATARTITATIDYFPFVVLATLNYSWNGVPQPPISMFFDNGFPLGTATATLPAPPPNVLVTWSVTITDGIYYTQTATGTPFTDAYLTGMSIAASANQPDICTGNQVVLTGVINGPIPVAPAANTYCASTHSSGCSGDEITNVTLGTINNATSGCGGISHYTYFNGGGTQTTSLAANLSHTLSVSFGAHATQYFGAWIDYDHNGVYDASEFLGASANAGANGTIAVIFTVPVTAFNGLTHMRIVGGNDAVVTATQACGASSSTWGETQDYDVTITGTEPGFVLPVTYTWKDGTNNTVASNNPATINPTATNSYTVTATDANGCSVVSSPVTVTVNPVPSFTLSASPANICSGTAVNITATTPTVTFINEVNGFTANTGLFFDIKNEFASTITINSIRLRMATPFTAPLTGNTNAQYNVYMTTTASTALGNEGTPANWTLLANPLYTFPPNSAGQVYFADLPLGANSFSLAGGASKGIYLQAPLQAEGQFLVAYVLPANTVPSVTNNGLTVISRNSASGSFIASGLNRTFHGRIGYTNDLAYSWTRDNDVNVTGPTSGTGMPVTSVLTNTGNTAQPVVYTVTASSIPGCSTAVSTTITVLPNNSISLSSLPGTDAQTVCMNNPITDITYTTANATGATFSGLPGGVSGSWVDNSVLISGAPAVAGTYNYTITLTGGCGLVEMSGTITVNALPTVSFSGLPGTICGNAPAITLTGSPTGGTFSGPGISGNNFDPALAGSGGTYSITYSYTDGNGCTNSSSQTITVNNPPSVSISGNLSFCTGSSTVLYANPPSSVRYASNVIAVSSEYNAGTPGPWSAAQALGLPDVYPVHGDIQFSWASATTDNQREYLELGYASPAPINFIDIYETFKPGAVDTVYVKNPNTGLFEIVYTATASVQPDAARILHIAFPLTAFPVSEIRIALNSPAVPDWNEIDAVAIGRRFESILWSTGSTADSIIVTAPGNYSVTVTDGNACTGTASVSVVETSLDFVNLQWPSMATICNGTDFTAYGLVGEAGVTGTYGVPGAGITAEVGYSTTNTDPSTWTNWLPTTFNALATWQPKDEYFASFGSSLAPGTYYFTFRYSLNGCGYQYGGYSTGGGGTWDGTSYVNGILTVNDCGPVYSTLNLTAFLEGFYYDINTMRANIYDLGISTDPSETDTVKVNLWAPASLPNTDPDYTVKAVIHTNGTASMQFPATVTGNEFYIAVKHRNHMETWSKLPVTFTSTTSYDFSGTLAQAYDDGVNPPMASVAGGKFAFYGGDVNQDGTVDGSDMSIVDNDNAIFAFGYNDSDVSGDGATDGLDVLFIDNNQPLFLFYARPY